MGLDVTLEFGIYLPHGGFLANFQVFRAIIPYHASPEGVVQIQYKGFFIFPENGLDNIAQIIGELRNRLHAKTIFVHMPVK